MFGESFKPISAHLLVIVPTKNMSYSKTISCLSLQYDVSLYITGVAGQSPAKNVIYTATV